MRQDERESLRQRFHFRCGYCGVREQDVGAELTNDHFQPRSRGGSDEPENWVYCCHCCNEFKGDFWQPDSIQRILHPLRDDVTANIVQEENGMLRALTETGDFHITRLHLNRPQLVAYRIELRLLEIARERQNGLIAKLQELEAHVQTLTARLAALEHGELPS